MDLNTDKMIAEVDGHIGWMIFNNPEKRNAISLEMWEAVEKILSAFEEDKNVRLIVMKGAGDRAFVSGADISQFEKNRADASAAQEYEKISSNAREKLGTLTKPLIAMIQGYCLGGGMGIALQADIRIASDDSQLGIPAARLSIAYGFDSIKRLSDLVGPSFAKHILFTGKRLTAQEALQIGLVNQVTSKDDLEQVIRDYANVISENAPLSIMASKFSIDQTREDESKRNMGKISEMSQTCFNSKDYKEGRTAFMEKRKPDFKGE
ncbi:MAG: enoyl-CoA hydratase [Nitrospinota bacterium]|nr:enoyl-CoA hydratase [Nitrospinota bacterium]